MFREVFIFVFGLVLASALPWDPVDQPGYPLNRLKKDVEASVVGGSVALVGQFPHQAALRTPAGMFFCGAVIISNRWVLSAAHCTINRDLIISFRVVVGTLNHQTGTEFALARVVNHPQYNRETIANDISAAQVQGTFTFSNAVNQVAMGSDFVGGGGNARIAGWGATTTGGNPTNQLMFFATTTITNADCVNRFTAAGENRAASFVFPHKICTFSRAGQGICQGDSGGGLLVGTAVIGIVSWNIPCGQGVPDVYDRVASHRAWINSVTGI